MKKDLDNTYLDTWVRRKKVLNDLNYSDYLKSKEWAAIKNKADKRPFYKKCLKCGSQKNIHLHHRSYKWLFSDHPMRGIVPLCEFCHKELHEMAKNSRISVRKATSIYLKSYYKEIFQDKHHAETRNKNQLSLF